MNVDNRISCDCYVCIIIILLIIQQIFVHVKKLRLICENRIVKLSMIGDTFERKDCQGGDCKVFELKTATKAKRKVYNTTLTKDM